MYTFYFDDVLTYEINGNKKTLLTCALDVFAKEIVNEIIDHLYAIEPKATNGGYWLQYKFYGWCIRNEYIDGYVYSSLEYMVSLQWKKEIDRMLFLFRREGNIKFLDTIIMNQLTTVAINKLNDVVRENVFDMANTHAIYMNHDSVSETVMTSVMIVVSLLSYRKDHLTCNPKEHIGMINHFREDVVELFQGAVDDPAARNNFSVLMQRRLQEIREYAQYDRNVSEAAYNSLDTLRKAVLLTYSMIKELFIFNDDDYVPVEIEPYSVMTPVDNTKVYIRFDI